MPLGQHVCKSDTEDLSVKIQEAVSHAESLGIKLGAVQIFCTGPKTFTETLTAQEKSKIRQLVNRTDIKILVHSNYVSSPWGEKAGAIWIKRKELKICEEIGAYGLVIHLQRVPKEDIARIIKTRLMPTPAGVKLFLEQESARANENSYETPEKLTELFKLLKKVDPEIGLILDTAHIWAAGVDISSYKVAKKYLNALMKIKNIGLHLNDSIKDLNAGCDVHAPLMHGKIWGKYNPDNGYDGTERAGFEAFLEWAEKNDAVTILERYGQIDTNKDFIRLHQMGYFLI